MQPEVYILRPSMVIGGLLGLLTGIIHIFADLEYTKTVVCIYLSLFSILIFTSGLSAQITKNYFSGIFPFLSSPLPKGIFLMLISFLCFGNELGVYGTISGIFIFFSGFGYIVCGLAATPPSKEYQSPPQSLYEPPNLISN